MRLFIGKAFALFFALVANTANGKTFVLTFIAALLHEITHLVFLFCCGCEKAQLEFFPGGIKLSADGFTRLSYKNTILCTLCAPVMNISAGALSYLILLVSDSALLQEFASVNLILGFCNLLPLYFLDGGRALNAFLLNKYDFQKVAFICDFFAVLSLLLIAGVFFVAFCFKKYYVFILFFFIYCVLGCFCDKTGRSFT